MAKKYEIKDDENLMTVYSDETFTTCFECGKKIMSGIMISGYEVRFDPDKKEIHPVHWAQKDLRLVKKIKKPQFTIGNDEDNKNKTKQKSNSKKGLA